MNGERTPRMVALDFIEDGVMMRARLANPDGPDDEIVVGSILLRVCMERPDLFQLFEKLMTDALVAAIVSMYGAESNPQVLGTMPGKPS